MSDAELPQLQDLLPRDNYIHDLRIDTESGPGETETGRLEVTPDVRTAWGSVDLGAVFALMDAASGRLALRSAHPDVVVTSEMSLYPAGPLTGDVLEVRGRVLRRGRRTVAIEMSITAGTGAAEVALGEAIFTTLPSRVPTRPGAQGGLFAPGARAALPVRERSGIRVLDAAAGVVEAPLSGYQRNHVGALHGSLVASLADCAAEALAGSATGRPQRTLDLALRFLGLGRVGPVRTRARALRPEPEGLLCRIALHDAGEQDRVVAVATATTRAVGAAGATR